MINSNRVKQQLLLWFMGLQLCGSANENENHLIEILYITAVDFKFKY